MGIYPTGGILGRYRPHEELQTSKRIHRSMSPWASGPPNGKRVSARVVTWSGDGNGEDVVTFQEAAANEVSVPDNSGPILPMGYLWIAILVYITWSHHHGT